MKYTFVLNFFLLIGIWVSFAHVMNGQIIVPVVAKEATNQDSEQADKVTLNSMHIVPDFDRILESKQLKGSILLFDQKDEQYFSNDFQWAEIERLPASTFKIPNSIIALETGVMANDSTIIPWNGEKRFLKSWEQDLSFRQAFQLSCVPCYQEIARKIGVERMKIYLDKLGYGGMEFDGETIDRFWLEGNSGISQMQQITFLKRFYDQQLPISYGTYELIKKLMFVHKDYGYSLFGKTGMAARDGSNNGWYVGFIEKEEQVIFFATNVIPTVDMSMETFGPLRISASVEALNWILENRNKP